MRSTMRVPVATALLLLLPLGLLAGADDRDFSGNWTLDQQQSDLRGLPERAGVMLTISQQGSALQCTSVGVTWSLRLDGADSKYKTRWEGSALFIDALAAGAQDYVSEDRWQLSADRTVLTITRTIGQAPSATLVYIKEGPAEIVVAAGTKIPLSLINSLNTKYSVEGDRVYLETAFPIVQRGSIVIPKGSYVAGTVTEVKRPTHMKGKAEMFLRFDSLTLPNGVTRDFRSRLDSADGNNVDRQEGKIRAEPDKAGDARTVGETAGAGATIGGLAGRSLMGVGVGAVGGAAAGLAGVLLSHGPDVILPKGTTLEMVLDRELRYAPAEVRNR